MVLEDLFVNIDFGTFISLDEEPYSGMFVDQSSDHTIYVLEGAQPMGSKVLVDIGNNGTLDGVIRDSESSSGDYVAGNDSFYNHPDFSRFSSSEELRRDHLLEGDQGLLDIYRNRLN